MPVITMDGWAATTSIAPEHCERLYGGSIKVCACRLPDNGGWLPCPAEAHGVLGPAPVPPVPVSHGALAVPETDRVYATAISNVTTLAPEARSSAPVMTGEMCNSCGAFAMRRTGTCSECMVCYESSGGCS